MTGTYVWRTCPGSLPGSVPGESRTSDLAITSPTHNRYTLPSHRSLAYLIRTSTMIFWHGLRIVVDLSVPVSDGEKVFRVHGVALNGVDRPVVRLEGRRHSFWWDLRLATADVNVSMLRADHELCRLKTSTPCRRHKVTTSFYNHMPNIRFRY